MLSLKTNNKYGEVEYLIYSFITFFVGCFWYRSAFLVTIGPYDIKSTAKYLFYPIFVGLFLFSIYYTLDKRRNATSLLDVLIPCEVMTAVCYFEEIKGLVYVCSGVFLLSSIAFAVWVLSNKIKSKNVAKRRKIILGRIKYSLLMARCLFIASFSVLLIFVFCHSYITPAIEAKKYERYRNSEEAQMMTMEYQYENLAPLVHEDVWEKLDAQQRKEILDIVLKMEVYRLGLPHTITLKTESNDKKTRLGVYNDKEHSISIYNIEDMDSVKALCVLLHEVFHSAEYRIVDVYTQYLPEKYKNLYFFNGAESYQYEFSNYINGSDNYELYSTQRCESDANDYANQRGLEIIREICKWLDGNTDDDK